jgi:hypothetical protein
MRADQIATQLAESTHEAKAALSAAAEVSYVRASRATSKRAQILALRGEIQKMRAKGATWEDVAEVLRSTVGATADTIRFALRKQPKRRAAQRSRAVRAAEPQTNPDDGTASSSVAVEEKIEQQEAAGAGEEAHDEPEQYRPRKAIQRTF